MTTTNEKSKVFSIIVNGPDGNGKLTTIQEVCKQLSPTEIHKMNLDTAKLTTVELADIKKGTFILKVRDKYVLVIAAAPTKQGKNIKKIYDMCRIYREKGIEITFILSAMRRFERLPEYDTPAELREISELLFIEYIYRVKEDDFRKAVEWIGRIRSIVNCILGKLAEL
jgi:hypothetical protein